LIPPIPSFSITELEKRLLNVIEKNSNAKRKNFAKELGISLEIVKEYRKKSKRENM
jgi:DNA-binding Lrp family transcriptional regulator